MPTIAPTHRAETRSIAIAAPPADVFAFLADPTNLPRWAPAFAQTVVPDGAHWRVISDRREALITVRASAEHGTVDLLATDDQRRGAFSRVLPSGGGSEFLFTLLFPPGTDDGAIEAQMDVVHGELEAVRRLTED